MKRPFAHRPRGRRRGLRHALPGLCAAFLGLCAACSEDAETLYANTPAFFRFQPVTSAPQLYTALNSPGMFCAITFTSTHYVFTGPDGGTSSFPRTATEAYGKPFYISGFLVGTPAIPDMESGTAGVAYDLACANCDADDGITRPVAFKSGTTVGCERCERVYDLNNGGRVCEGEGGRSLYRYRLSYSEPNNSLLISN